MNQHGYDVLEGLGADRSSIQVQQVPVRYASTSLHPVVHESDTLTLVVDNVFALAGQAQIELYVALGY